jgi:hypothetical protein
LFLKPVCRYYYHSMFTSWNQLYHIASWNATLGSVFRHFGVLLSRQLLAVRSRLIHHSAQLQTTHGLFYVCNQLNAPPVSLS